MDARQPSHTITVEAIFNGLGGEPEEVPGRIGAKPVHGHTRCEG